MKPQEFFIKHPVFTYKEFTGFFEAKGSRSARTRDSLLLAVIRRIPELVEVVLWQRV
jgi:hypothetical protein